MSLHTLGRKVKMEILQQDGDVCELLFNGRSARHACRLLLDEIRVKRGLSRTELSRFSWDLHFGRVKEGFCYSRSRFYSHVRQTLLMLGLVGIQQRPADSFSESFEPELRRRPREVVDKYVAVWQPIAKRAPDGLNLVRLTWIIAKKWNDEFFGGG